MKNTDETPIFIVGTPRSGTTLTAKLLGGHRDIFMPGETHFFDDIYSRREALGDPATQDGANRIASHLISLYGRYNEPEDQKRVDSLFTIDSLAKAICSSCSDYEDVLSFFMAMQANNYGKKFWGNNAPRDLFNVREISQFYPNAKIIVCVRDPRDFLGSYKGKWRATANNEMARLKKLYHPVVTSFLWKANMKQLFQIQHYFPEKNVYILKYEALVTSPGEKVNELCKHIGVEYDDSMLELSFSNSSDGGGGNKQIFTSSIGGWDKRISQEEAWLAQKVCSTEMAKLGYNNDILNVRFFKIIAYVMGAPVALWRALEANKHKRGPLIPYILKRLTSAATKG